MSDPLQVVKVMRNKEVIGDFKLADIPKLLAEGTLLPSDLYWFKGMAGWVRLDQLQASEDAKLKSKAQEDRLVAEAVKGRLEQERRSQFRCNCCHLVFKKPNEISAAPGVLLWFLSLIGFGVSSLFLGSFAPFALFGCAVSLILLGAGFCVFLASLIRHPYCPGCESKNFSKPE